MINSVKKLKLKKIIKGIIKEQLLLKEYFTNDIVYLKKYLSLSDEEKINYLPYDFSYLIDEFIKENDIELENPSILEDYESAVEYLEKENKPLFLKFGKYLLNKIEDHTMPITDAEYPAWSMFDDPKIIKNQWLIHFTDDAHSIAKKGFIYGVSEMEKLGLTTHLGDFEKKYGGYNFAYTLNDYGKYSENRFGRKYGEEAVIFNASGIRMWHHGDDEPQVIFYGNTATNIIPITRGEEFKYGLYSSNGKLLYENDKLDKVVDWLVKNFPQYRKQLLQKKKIIKENFDERFILINANNESEDLELENFDIYKESDNAYKIAKNEGLNILRDKELIYILFDNQESKTIGGLWTTQSENPFSFDIAIDKEYQNKGLSSILIKAAISEFEMQKEYTEDLKIEVDVINPKLAEILKRKYGFKIKQKIGKDRVLMGF